jgi:hypothetical protein
MNADVLGHYPFLTRIPGEELIKSEFACKYQAMKTKKRHENTKSTFDH